MAAMRRSPVFLNIEKRPAIAQWFVESLVRRKIDLVALCVDATHVHLLGRFRRRNPDHLVGIAKKESSHFAKQSGIAEPGGLWAGAGKFQPIHDRAHQLATVRYILNHRAKGAAIWFNGKLLPPL